MSSNELRQVIGIKPSDDPKADMLINSNLNQSPEQLAMQMGQPLGSGVSMENYENPMQVPIKELEEKQ